jgi:2-keto-4-pentenoate hydratase/2-oxohepta-3-ene-1,7-dioic acid hydratase in catechol pathway
MIRIPIIGTNRSYDIAPTKIIAVGLNYRDHVAESAAFLDTAFLDPAFPDPTGAPGSASSPGTLPAEPILFPKTPNVLVANGEPIVIPSAFLAHYGFTAPRTDFEAELAVIMGRRCRNVSEAEARAYVLGYTCFNDVSQRDIQNGDRSGWFRGKSFDSFGPIGPALLHESSGVDPQALRISCRLNGELVQSSNTRAMIFGIAALVSFISRNFTLEPGDIIATGTPSGVGALKPGDLVEVEIEAIGVLKNPVVEE